MIAVHLLVKHPPLGLCLPLIAKHIHYSSASFYLLYMKNSAVLKSKKCCYIYLSILSFDMILTKIHDFKTEWSLNDKISPKVGTHQLRESHPYIIVGCNINNLLSDFDSGAKDIF